MYVNVCFMKFIKTFERQGKYQQKLYKYTVYIYIF